MNSKLKSVSS